MGEEDSRVGSKYMRIMLRFASGFDNPTYHVLSAVLSTYNLTVFELGTKKGNCFMWHEGVGKRGSTNIASCIWKYLTDNTESDGEGEEICVFQRQLHRPK